MKFLLPMLFIFCFAVVSTCADNAHADPTTKIELYLQHFFAKVKPSRLKKAMKLVPIVVMESEKNGFDPLLISVWISCESSWKPDVIGGIGEKGVLQVHGTCAKGHKLDTPESQIKAGVECFAMARDKCDGTIEQTLTMYASGKCKSKSKRTHKLIRRRLKIYERWNQ